MSVTKYRPILITAFNDNPVLKSFATTSAKHDPSGNSEEAIDTKTEIDQMNTLVGTIRSAMPKVASAYDTILKSYIIKESPLVIPIKEQLNGEIAAEASAIIPKLKKLGMQDNDIVDLIVDFHKRDVLSDAYELLPPLLTSLKDNLQYSLKEAISAVKEITTNRSPVSGEATMNHYFAVHIFKGLLSALPFIATKTNAQNARDLIINASKKQFCNFFYENFKSIFTELTPNGISDKEALKIINNIVANAGRLAGFIQIKELKNNLVSDTITEQQVVRAIGTVAASGKVTDTKHDKKFHIEFNKAVCKELGIKDVPKALLEAVTD